MDRTIEVFYGEQYEAGWPPGRFAEFIEWAQQLMETIPAEHRRTATFEIATSTMYDSTYATIRVTYSRPETDDEKREREELEEARARAHETQERQMYQRLREKFGP